MHDLTAHEIAAMQALPNDAPYAITAVSNGFFSVARHAGAIEFRGYVYIYQPQSDMLIRSDALKLLRKLRRAERKRPAQVETPEQQQDLPF